jgi:hypothetical protein
MYILFSSVESLQNFLAFSEYMNFIKSIGRIKLKFKNNIDKIVKPNSSYKATFENGPYVKSVFSNTTMDILKMSMRHKVSWNHRPLEYVH